MTFSPLISGTLPHHNKFSSRAGASVNRVIQHHWASTSLAGEAALVSPTTKKSVNYLVYNDGTIKGQVPEEYRPWTSGSAAVDNSSITIEAQNQTSGPEWKVSDAAINSIVRLIAEIATRRGWGSYSTDTYRGHREFASTACPGPYLWPRLQSIRDAANALRANSTPIPPATEDNDMDAQERQWLIETHEAMGRMERAWGSTPRPDGSGRDYTSDLNLDRTTETLVIVQGLASSQGVDVDEEALAAALLPHLVSALKANIGTLTPETLQEIAKVVADEDHRRSAE